MRVTLNLGPPTSRRAGGWALWFAAAAGLGDISVFASPANTTRHLITFRISRTGAIRFRTIAVPDGTGGNAAGQDLTDAWEGFSAAITVSSAGLADLVITGPAAAESTQKDTTEPYQWYSGNAVTAWFDAYVTAGWPAVTIVLDDGVSASVDLAGRATVGASTARGALRVALAASVDLAGRATVGASTARGALRVALAASVDLAGRATVGASTARGALRVALAPEVRVPPAAAGAPSARAGLAKYRTVDGDVLDAVCWRHYGREDAVPDVLAANPGLADAEPILSAGVVIELPELSAAAVRTVVRLWGRETA